MGSYKFLENQPQGLIFLKWCFLRHPTPHTFSDTHDKFFTQWAVFPNYRELHHLGDPDVCTPDGESIGGTFYISHSLMLFTHFSYKVDNFGFWNKFNVLGVWKHVHCTWALEFIVETLKQVEINSLTLKVLKG